VKGLPGRSRRRGYTLPAKGKKSERGRPWRHFRRGGKKREGVSWSSTYINVLFLLFRDEGEGGGRKKGDAPCKGIG